MDGDARDEFLTSIRFGRKWDARKGEKTPHRPYVGGALKEFGHQREKHSLRWRIHARPMPRRTRGPA